MLFHYRLFRISIKQIKEGREIPQKLCKDIEKSIRFAEISQKRGTFQQRMYKWRRGHFSRECTNGGESLLQTSTPDVIALSSCWPRDSNNPGILQRICKFGQDVCTSELKSKMLQLKTIQKLFIVLPITPKSKRWILSSGSQIPDPDQKIWNRNALLKKKSQQKPTLTTDQARKTPSGSRNQNSSAPTIDSITRTFCHNYKLIHAMPCRQRSKHAQRCTWANSLQKDSPNRNSFVCQKQDCTYCNQKPDISLLFNIDKTDDDYDNKQRGKCVAPNHPDPRRWQKSLSDIK